MTPDTVFDCHHGVYRIGARTLHDAHGYGRLSVRDIIAYSSNIGMAQVGERLGPERMYAGLSLFGFGRKTGIELPGESAGLLHPLRQWTRLSVSSIPMGQEIAVSALQLTAGFCAFANGGWWVRPRIVLGTADSQGRNMLQNAPPPVFHRVLDEQVAKLMCGDLLAAVVERGTARDSAIAGYSMSGKTGTPAIVAAGRARIRAGRIRLGVRRDRPDERAEVRDQRHDQEAAGGALRRRGRRARGRAYGRTNPEHVPGPARGTGRAGDQSRHHESGVSQNIESRGSHRRTRRR